MRTKTVLAALAAALAVLTVFSREWIEVLFGVDPDGGSGALEWGLVIALALVAAALGISARADRTRLRAVAGGGPA